MYIHDLCQFSLFGIEYVFLSITPIVLNLTTIDIHVRHTSRAFHVSPLTFACRTLHTIQSLDTLYTKDTVHILHTSNTFHT